MASPLRRVVGALLSPRGGTNLPLHHVAGGVAAYELLECSHRGRMRAWRGEWPLEVAPRRRCSNCAAALATSPASSPPRPRLRVAVDRVSVKLVALRAEGVPADVARELAGAIAGLEAFGSAFRRAFGGDDDA